MSTWCREIYYKLEIQYILQDPSPFPIGFSTEALA